MAIHGREALRYSLAHGWTIDFSKAKYPYREPGCKFISLIEVAVSC